MALAFLNFQHRNEEDEEDYVGFVASGGSEDDAELSDEEDNYPEEHDKEISFEPEPPEEGIYGMAVAAVVIDSRKIFHPESTPFERFRHGTRFCLAMFLVFFTLGMQIYITLMTKFIVTPEDVKDVRKAYGKFEVIMYDNHTTLTKFGHNRGIDGFYNIENFAKMSEDESKDLCALGLTQPVFLLAILLLWTITSLKYMRKNIQFTIRLSWIPSNAWSMTDSNIFKKHGKDKYGKRRLANLPLLWKIFIIVAIQIPVIFANGILLWVGCRWLLATVGFGDLLLNAIALEFILVMHEVLYYTVTPQSLRYELGSMVINPVTLSQPPNMMNMLASFGMFVLAVSWTFAYVYVFQQVLPDYKWDVKAACEHHGFGQFRWSDVF